MVLSPRFPSDISVLSVTSVIGALAHRGELRDAIAERPRQDPMPFIARVDTVGEMPGVARNWLRPSTIFWGSAATAAALPAGPAAAEVLFVYLGPRMLIFV